MAPFPAASFEKKGARHGIEAYDCRFGFRDGVAASGVPCGRSAPDRAPGVKDRAVEPLELANTTGDAAFATDKNGRVVAWNAAAERLLGHTTARIVGRRCSDVLSGIDVFGNPYCSGDCVLLKSALQGVPLRRFELGFRSRRGDFVAVTISTIRVPNSDPQGVHIVHLLHPVDPSSPAAPGTSRAAAGTLCPSHALTARERQVLRFVSEGNDVASCSEKLGISVTTVRTHLRNIRTKLEVRSTLEAACIALRNGLI